MAQLQLGGNDVLDLGLEVRVRHDPFTGGLTCEVPIPMTQARAGLTPDLGLRHASRQNSPFGTGWSLTGVSSVGVDRRHEAPRYDGHERFLLDGQVELAPLFAPGTTSPWVERSGTLERAFFRKRLGPRDVRLERWLDTRTRDVHWRERDARGVVTLFGQTGASRLFDPEDPSRCASWLVDRIVDPHGNAIDFEYVSEDERGVDLVESHERSRRGKPQAQRYLKRIRYGNLTPLSPAAAPLPSDQYAYEVVLDYGEHSANRPTADQPWPARSDAFSSYRAGFEIRTRRLCRRVLLFHRFPALGAAPALVQELRLAHALAPSGARLDALTLIGHRIDGPSRAMPPVRFAWSNEGPSTDFETAKTSALTNTPVGLNGSVRLIDLTGDGLPGLLTETAGAWYYKANEGNGDFAPQAAVLERPASSNLFALGDSDHDGNPDVSRLHGRLAGSWALDRNSGRWRSFEPVASMAHHEGHPDAQWLDLNADGRPDLVFNQGDHVVWYPSSEAGFEAPVLIPRPVGANALPLLSERISQRTFFADMTGDGLLDLVQVGNGRVEYWPHLGNGRFGEAVAMEDAPRFDDDDSFDPRRLRLVSLTGDSRVGFVYVGRREVKLVANACGNRLITLASVQGGLTSDALTSARVCDYFGDGRQCLVLSSERPDAPCPSMILPLTARVLPGTLLAVDDGQGLRTEVEWSSSATHYLRARRSDEPWRTRLPAHVPVVESLSQLDLVTGARTQQRFTYADGVLDARRGVLGFGRVDALDASPASAGEESFSAPLLTRRWFHQGQPVWGQLPAASYGLDPHAPSLAPHEFVDGHLLGDADFEDALAALAGTPYREERFAVEGDGTRAAHPFDVTVTRQRVQRRQPRQGVVGPCWALTTGDELELVYEGRAGDPRVTHTCVLSLDESEQVNTRVELSYPRRAGRPVDVAAQSELSVVVSRESRALVETADAHLAGVPLSDERVELHGLAPRPNEYLWAAAFETPAVIAALAAPLPHHQRPAPGQLAARVVERNESFYWDDAGAHVLPHGQTGAKALLHHDESACFTSAALTQALGGRVVPSQLGPLGYLLRGGVWWAPGETQHWTGFGQLARLERGDGAIATYRYDTHELALVGVDSAVGPTRATIDYHQVSPDSITDPNGTRSAVRFDALGVAIAGSRTGTLRSEAGTVHPWGDAPLSAWVAPAGDGVSAALTNPTGALQGASWAAFYDLTGPGSGTPLRRVMVQRSQHLHDGAGGVSPTARPEVSVDSFDGFGRTLQRKQRVPAGLALARDAQGRLELDATGRPLERAVSDRWLTSGFAVLDHKQLVGRQYEPFFSAIADFEDDPALRLLGGSALHRFDALGRPVGVVTREGTQARSEYMPWEIRDSDGNDLVDGSTWKALRSGLAANHPEALALQQALPHADSPSIRYLGPDGRDVARLERGSTPAEDRWLTFEVDAMGTRRSLIGPRGTALFEYVTDMTGQRLRTRSVDAGESFAFEDAWGRAVSSWDARGTQEVRSYDTLDRLTSVAVGGQILESFTWGDSASSLAGTNTVGRLVRQQDQAGERRWEAYWPDGAPARTARQLCSRWDIAIDWATSPALDPEIFRSEAFFDALGRPTRQRLADSTERTWQYLQGGMLEGQRLATVDGAFTQQVTSLLSWDALGRRRGVRLGAVDLTNDFDPLSARLSRQRASRGVATLQDSSFTYDPVGNVTRVDDAAQRPGVASAPLQGLVASAEQDFVYDAHYRLVRASGRVHQSLLAGDDVPGATSGVRHSRHLSLNNGMAVERYTRDYRYDVASNLMQRRHTSPSRTWSTDWWISATSNRSIPALDATGLPVSNPETHFDAAGAMQKLGHLRRLEWDSRGRLRLAVVIDRAAQGRPDDAEHYVYGADGLRARTVTSRLKTGNEVELTERIVLDGCELKRVRRSSGVVLERWTSHCVEGGEKIASFHRWTRDDAAREVDSLAETRFRYSLTNQVGSALLAFDETGAVVSYEEYFPYGGSAFIAGDSMREIKLRQWRFSGKQRDDITGLYDFGHRLYAPWLGRWLSPDPIGPADSLNLYEFARSNPSTLRDREGLSSSGDYQQYGTIPLQVQGKPITERQAVTYLNGTFGLKNGFQVTRLEKIKVENDPNGAWFIPKDALRKLNPEIARMAQRDVKKARQLMAALESAGLDPTTAMPPGGDEGTEGGQKEAEAGKEESSGDSKTGESGESGESAESAESGTGEAKGAQAGAAGGTGLEGASPGGSAAESTDTADGSGTGTQGEGAGASDETGEGLLEAGAGGVDGRGQGERGGADGAGGDDTRTREGKESGTGTETGGTSTLPSCDEGKQVAPPGLKQNGDDVNGSPSGASQGVRGGSGAQAQRKRSGRGDYSGQRGGPGSHPGSGGGAGSGDATALDKITKVAGWTELEFDSPSDGVSGGIPGGRGSISSGWGQALYVVLAIASVVGLVRTFAKKAFKQLMRAVFGHARALSIFARAARTVLRRFFEWVGNLSLAEAKKGVKLSLRTRLTRFFITDVDYAEVWRSPIGRLLEKIPGTTWEQGHVFILQRWFRGGSPNQWYRAARGADAAAKAAAKAADLGLRRLGNAGWNLMPQPQWLNRLLGHSPWLSALFGVGTAAAVPGVGYGSYKATLIVTGEDE